MLYALLIEALGGACSACGSQSDLTVDHWQGREWKLREVPYYKRVQRYLGEYERGLLRCLCRSCNSKQGRPLYKEEQEVEEWERLPPQRVEGSPF